MQDLDKAFLGASGEATKKGGKKKQEETFEEWQE